MNAQKNTSILFAIRLTVVGALMLMSLPIHAQTRPSIAGLQAQIATLQTQVVPNLAGYLTMDLSTPSRPTLRVAGANLQIVNGLGTTQSVNGVGNLIVGYDESRASGSVNEICSIGGLTDDTSCEGSGGTWALNHKSGSHNVVVGRLNNYSQYGGIVAGATNTINGTEASIVGGNSNIASGPFASVSGGYSNTASGLQASVSGGQDNSASATTASVSGGNSNIATALSASVSGGLRNTASAIVSSLSGGENNQAMGYGSSVSGGANRSVISTDDDGWRAGGLFQDN